MNCACGTPLYKGNKSGKCLPCLSADPAFRARRGAAIRAAWTPEMRSRLGETMSERRMAHVPVAYRDEYRAIMRKRAFSSDEAIRIVIEHAEAEVRRARA